MSQLANHVRIKTKFPVVGDGVTVFHYTDRSAGTVERISPSGKTVWIRPDRAIRKDRNGMSESQQYAYEPVEDAKLMRATLRKDGQWRLSGYMGYKVAFGFRDAYHDYSF